MPQIAGQQIKERDKIETFVLDMVRKVMVEKLIFPNFITIPNAISKAIIQNSNNNSKK